MNQHGDGFELMYEILVILKSEENFLLPKILPFILEEKQFSSIFRKTGKSFYATIKSSRHAYPDPAIFFEDKFWFLS